MFKKILIPVDFSEPSMKIVNRVSRFKALGLKEVILLYGAMTVDVFTGEMYVNISYAEDLKTYAEKQMSAMKTALEAEGISVKTVIEYGNPSVLILDTAKNESADLIIMASHGQGANKGFHLGSVASGVLHNSHKIHVPVLIKKVGWEKDEAGKDVPKFIETQVFSKVIFPTDFSTRSYEVLDVVRNLAGIGIKEVVLTHIQDTGKLLPHLEDKLDDFNEIDQKRLDKIKEELEPLGLKVKTVIEQGVPVVKIVEVADRENADMIVMGSHGRSPFIEFLLGSVSEKVTKKSAKPVMVV